MSFQVDNMFWLGCDSQIIAAIMNQDNESAVKGDDQHWQLTDEYLYYFLL